MKTQATSGKHWNAICLTFVLASDSPSEEFLARLTSDVCSKGPCINWDFISWKSLLFHVITGCHIHNDYVTEGVKKTSKVRDGR